MTSESAELIVLKSINNKLIELIDIFKIKGVVSKTLADFSKSERPQSATDKSIPETLGEYILSKTPCRKCGGKITWDNYNETDHKYPDHLTDNGEIMLNGCPEWNK